MTTLLDPTSESQPAQRQGLPRPQSLAGKRVGLLDISKPRGDIFPRPAGGETGLAGRGGAAL